MTTRLARGARRDIEISLIGRAVDALSLMCDVLRSPDRAAAAYGDGLTIGIGGLIGEPVGFSMKWLIADGHALQGVIGFDLWYRDGFLTAVDWVWHPLIITSPSALDLSFHVGAGLFLGVWYDRYWDGRWGGSCDYDRAHDRYYNCHAVGFGGHFPVGLDLLFKAVPIELSFEFAPGLWFYPYVGFSAFGGVHVRYFF